MSSSELEISSWKLLQYWLQSENHLSHAEIN